MMTERVIEEYTLAEDIDARLATDQPHAFPADGSRLGYVGANGTTLFVRPLDQLEATPLVRGGAPRDPFVSPDGQWVGFFDGGLTL